LPDYVSEKIFDAFISGCIPIYWGTNTINTLIPSNCFIDRRNFKDTRQVHQYLLSITPDQYQTMQNNIWFFLNSPAIKKFDASNYVNTIVSTILRKI
jgi:hypothetical protein